MIWLVWYVKSSFPIHLAPNFPAACSLVPGSSLGRMLKSSSRNEIHPIHLLQHNHKLRQKMERAVQREAHSVRIFPFSFLPHCCFPFSLHPSVHPPQHLVAFFPPFLLLPSSSFLSTVVFSQRSNVYSQAITTLKISCNYPRIPRY